MPREKAARRKRSDSRMPVRDSHAEERMDARPGGPDFDLRRARDAPSSAGTFRKQRRVPAALQAEENLQPFLTDQRQQGDPSPMEDFSGNLLEQETVKETEVQSALEPAPCMEPFAQKPDRRNFRHESLEHANHNDSADSGRSAQGRTGRAERRYRAYQRDNKYLRRFQEVAKTGQQEAQTEGTVGSEAKRSSKLEFTADELPLGLAEKKLEQTQRKAGQESEKRERARESLPSYRKLRMEEDSGPDAGKRKKNLKFEQEAKAKGQGAMPGKAVKGGINAVAGQVHKEVYQEEEENVGIQAAHHTEIAGEAVARGGYRMHKAVSYRRDSKLRTKSARTDARSAYRRALHDDPGRKKNVFARMWQKQKVKRQYAKAAREAQKAGKGAKDTVLAQKRLRQVLYIL